MYPAAKILWFKKHKPELFRRIRMMFMCDDYILWKMSGRMVSHGSSWCTSYLWDITRKQWWPEMLDYLGLDEYQLPTLYETGTPIGTILPQIDQLRPELAHQIGKICAQPDGSQLHDRSVPVRGIPGGDRG